jgi:2-C-methyl-D-erythritol 4-phosphate cytidylyltransferase
VQVLTAPASNIKLTTRFDLSIAAAVISARGQATAADFG